MLLVASYYFYMNWEPVYALLILFSSVTTWLCGLGMERYGSKKRILSGVCIAVNLLILFIFKYFNFITVSIHDALSMSGIEMYVPKFDLLLPVGISFYTFQAIGYIVDVYRREIPAERSFLTYALFVAFFPQLVAGPIERAKNLLPQFHSHHIISGENLLEGFNMMIWGYFMKLCIADAVSPYVDAVFGFIPHHSGKSIWLASFFFTFQIFCDFCGYTLIAIGTAKCLGFDLMQNFRQPYLAVSIREFWRRWHISLSTWMADYIYKPLGGSRCRESKHVRNLMLTFLISGLWHGANWTFLLWGAYHGILQSIHSIVNKIKKKLHVTEIIISGKIKKVVTVLNIVITFLLVMLGWVLFRAGSIEDALLAYSKMLHPEGNFYPGFGTDKVCFLMFLILLLMCREIMVERGSAIRLTRNSNIVVSGITSGLLIFLIVLCGQIDGGGFIYFQF